MTSKIPLEVTLDDFARWLREQSSKVGYSRLIYLHSEDGKEAKQLQNRLMYLDYASEWGWLDAYVEYCSARCFASRVRFYRAVIEGGAHEKLEPLGSSSERLSPSTLCYVTLALYDIQDLTDDERGLQAILDICQQLTERGAYVVLTGNGYPSDIFKNYPNMTRFLLDGYVARIKDNEITFEGNRPIHRHPLPYFGLLVYGTEDCNEINDGFPLGDCKELLFQWELLCTWKSRYKLFDFDLFKDAFIGVWRFLQLKPKTETCRHRLCLMVLLGNFVEGVPFGSFALMTERGMSDASIDYGDPHELKAAEVFTGGLIAHVLQGKLKMTNCSLEICYRISHNETDYWHPEEWSRCVAISDFNEAIDELVLALRGNEHCLIQQQYP